MNNYKFLLIYFTTINIVSFILCIVDKQKAKKHKYRIPEKTFFYLSILGGPLGLLLGMYIFHHKTKHKKFTIIIPLILITWLIILIIIIKQKN